MSGRGLARAPRIWLVAGALVAVAGGALLGGRRLGREPTGFADPGAVVGIGVPLLESVALLLAVHTVGALLLMVVLAPGSTATLRARRSLVIGAAAWAAVTVVQVPLAISESSGISPAALTTGVLAGWATTTPALAAAGAALGAAVIALLSGPGLSRARATLLIALALASAAVPAVSDHLGEETAAGASGMVVHVVAALLWTGGLYALLVWVGADTARLAPAVRRFSTLALGCWAALLLSGLLALGATVPWERAAVPALLGSGYGAVLLGKAGLLVLLAGFGAWHRAASMPALARGEHGTFRRVALVEVGLLGGAFGLASALASTAAPLVSADDISHSDDRVEPLGVGTLLTTWRPNAVVVVVLVLAAGGYLAAVRSRRRAGGTWPATRTGAWLGGLVLLAALALGGVAAYAEALLSVHLVQLLATTLVVPLLLVRGRPWELLRAPRGNPLAAVPPALGATMVALLIVLVHRPEVLELSMSAPWWHLAILTLGLLSGLVLWSGIVGRPDRGGAGAWLAAVALALLVLGWRLRGEGLLAEGFFLDRRLLGTDPVGDQQAAAWVAVVVGLGLLASAAVLLTRAHSGDGHGSGNGPGRPSSVIPSPRSAETGVPAISPAPVPSAQRPPAPARTR